MRSERWNTGSELKRRFRDAADPAAGAGPVVSDLNSSYGARRGFQRVGDSRGFLKSRQNT